MSPSSRYRTGPSHEYRPTGAGGGIAGAGGRFGAGGLSQPPTGGGFGDEARRAGDATRRAADSGLSAKGDSLHQRVRALDPADLPLNRFSSSPGARPCAAVRRDLRGLPPRYLMIGPYRPTHSAWSSTRPTRRGESSSRLRMPVRLPRPLRGESLTGHERGGLRRVRNARPAPPAAFGPETRATVRKKLTDSHRGKAGTPSWPATRTPWRSGERFLNCRTQFDVDCLPLTMPLRQSDRLVCASRPPSPARPPPAHAAPHIPSHELSHP